MVSSKGVVEGNEVERADCLKSFPILVELVEIKKVAGPEFSVIDVVHRVEFGLLLTDRSTQIGVTLPEFLISLFLLPIIPSNRCRR